MYMKLFSWVKIDFIAKFQWRWMELKRDTGTVDGYTVYTHYTVLQNVDGYLMIQVNCINTVDIDGYEVS